MSPEQGFRDVHGVPKGYELLGFWPGSIGEVVIDGNGKPYELVSPTKSVCAIIRKIEAPKQYRPFANSEEFRPHRDRWVTRKYKTDSNESPGGCRVAGYDDNGVWWAGGGFQYWQSAFDAGRRFDDDRTPFGVEITSENPAS